ncbi:MAG: hypothetical protein ABI858_02185 [Pseudoxanthomonas sp.]
MNQLNAKQLAFVAGLQKGKDGTASAVAAGYSPKSARYTAWSLQNENKQVMAHLAEVRAEISEITKHDTQAAFAECVEWIALAKAAGDIKGAFKYIELKSRLCGHLVEKVDITVDRPSILEALSMASARAVRLRCDPVDADYAVIEAQPSLTAAQPPDKQSIPPLSGDQFPAKPIPF